MNKDSLYTFRLLFMIFFTNLSIIVDPRVQSIDIQEVKGLFQS